MADDLVEAGLEKTRLELEELAAKLSGGPEAMPETPADPLNSDAARDAGYAVAAALGEGLRALIFADRPEKPRPQRRPWRFTSPASPAQATASAAAGVARLVAEGTYFTPRSSVGGVAAVAARIDRKLRVPRSVGADLRLHHGNAVEGDLDYIIRRTAAFQ